MTFDIHPAVQHFEKSLRNLRCLLLSKTFAVFQKHLLCFKDVRII